MIPDTVLLIVSCEHRQPIQYLWLRYQLKNWLDCPFRIQILSPNREQDVGWNANLLDCLEGVTESYVLLMLDDHFIEEVDRDALTGLLDLMRSRSDIGMVKLQAGNAHPPESQMEWDDGRLGEYDREHHPFKRTNLVPTLFRKSWLERLSQAVLSNCGPVRDIGRAGALEFEITGTLLTRSYEEWSERMLGIHRAPPAYGGRSIIQCVQNDGVREGKLQISLPDEWLQTEGLGAFL